MSKSRIGRTLWWAYFALLTASFVWSLVGIRSEQGMASAVLSGVGLVGIWGYLRGIALGRRWFWVAYLWVLAIVVVCLVVGVALVWRRPGVASLAPILACGILVGIPEFVAIWRYTSHQQMLWSNAGTVA